MSENTTTAIVTEVQGNLVTARYTGSVMQNEVAFVHTGGMVLKGEVVEVDGELVRIQMFEITRGISCADRVTFDGSLMAVWLGPGLLGRVFDGLQNPLEEIAKEAGYFLPRGLYLEPLAKDTQWEFTPIAMEGDKVVRADFLGYVPEGVIEHKIMVPFGFYGKGTIKHVAKKGMYKIHDEIAKIEDSQGNVHTVTMAQRWPSRLPLRFGERRLPIELLETGCRIIDGPFPVAKGGTFCVPGPFGAGKTVLQHQISKHARTQIVIIVACGERAGEVVQLLREFPTLTDPHTGRKLMERTCIICNTSSMPVAARESSIYIGLTIAEYYRQMGIDCLLLADSTSRWAQALREMSGRLEEIPGEEAFPAYLASRIAELYDRAGLIRLQNGVLGSLTIGGSVSPAGDNFEEPVTQSTLAVVGCFLGLSRARSDARRFPAIDPLISWSKYLDRQIDSGTDSTAKWVHMIKSLQQTLKESREIGKKMAVIGEEGTSVKDIITYLKGEFYDASFLQQNSFDPVDTATSHKRLQEQIEVIYKVIIKEYNFKSRDEAHSYFLALTNDFLQWNYTKTDEPEYQNKKQAVLDRIELDFKYPFDK
ncbi:MAG: V-type ATP synthase subunit A [Candidatus Magnetoovum sp. WYHC-5]|nr:V-type ATP synthase subunit A [Candidatus Magnetoovum sp. WYHC-5]